MNMAPIQIALLSVNLKFPNRKRGNFVLPCFDFELFGVSNRNTKMEEKERRKHSSFMSTDAVRKKKLPSDRMGTNKTSSQHIYLF